MSATDIYEATEPLVNAAELEFLDHPKLQEQLLTLVVRGAKVTHQAGDHDDYANAACGCLALMPKSMRSSGEHRPPRVLHEPPKHGMGQWAGGGGAWDGWFMPTAEPGRGYHRSPRVLYEAPLYGSGQVFHRSSADAPVRLDDVKREWVAEAYWIGPHGPIAGDGRQRWAVRDGDDRLMRLVWGREEAEAAAAELSKPRP